MDFDLQRARSETPGSDNILYLNNAGASLSPTPVLNAVIAHLQREAMIGGYRAEAEARTEQIYRSLAVLLGCCPEEIALMDNATRAWNTAFGVVPLKAGDRVLISRSEYVNNSLTLREAKERLEVSVEVIPCDETGQLSLEALRASMDERVKLIAVTHVPTNGGLINPAAQVGQIAREWNTLSLLDASQSVGQMPINVNEIGCDLLAAPGRKYLRGPRGTGFLYVRRNILERLNAPPPDLAGSHWHQKDRYVPKPDAGRFEYGEASIAGRIGLGAAVDYALQWGIEKIWRRIEALATLLREQLSALPGVTVRDLGVHRCGLVTFTHAKISPEVIQQRLMAQQISIKASPSHQSPLDMNARGLESVARASIHYFNTESELERFVAALAAL